MRGPSGGPAGQLTCVAWDFGTVQGKRSPRREAAYTTYTMHKIRDSLWTTPRVAAGAVTP